MVFRCPGRLALQLAVALAILSGVSLPAEDVSQPDRTEILRHAADGEDGFWKRIATDEPYESLGCRKVFSSAMALCEARRHPERLQRLYEIATDFQDRDPQNAGYGNLRWYWRDSQVTDRNAVEFCMQDALATWIHHRDWIPEPARSELFQLIQFGMEGCMRHRVPTRYTNIALLNAGNLIVSGEMFDRPGVAEEGYRRLDAICLWTWRFGTCEFCSPTYYGTDLQGILFLEAYAQRDRTRQQARALAHFFWSDIALNWFVPARSLGGAHSRTYDYLRGLGGLDRFLWMEGWLGETLKAEPDMIRPARARWSPPSELLEQSQSELPRLVRQSWGPTACQSRTHMLYPDVTLSTSAANYGAHDMPLTIDLPGDRRAVRCYFIPDGREDPYGKVRYVTGAAGHRKALHLKPFWTAAQRTCDALGLVMFRDRDLSSDVVTNLQSHIVLRRDNDGIWIGGKRVDLSGASREMPARIPILVGDSLVLRYATAAVGIRVVWARAQNGQPSAAALIDDANPYGAIRLTIDHDREPPTTQAGAAFWVRVGSQLDDDTAFEAWRSAFQAATPKMVEASDQGIRLAIPGVDGPVTLSAASPFVDNSTVQLTPEPTNSPLELNGQDLGRTLLENVEPICTYRNQLARLQSVVVASQGDVGWEAETGLVFPGMRIDDDAGASAGQFVWHSKDSPVGSETGSLTFHLDVEKAGSYFLWARVFAPDPQTDSFYVLQNDTGARPPASASWHTGNKAEWTWRCLKLNRATDPTPLELPVGTSSLHFRVREAGTKIDRLFLTSDPQQVPE